MGQERIRAGGDLDRWRQEHHDYGDIIQGTRALSTLQQSLMHVLEIVCKNKVTFVNVFLQLYFGIDYD